MSVRGKIRNDCANCRARLIFVRIPPYLPSINRLKFEGGIEVVDHPDQKYASQCPRGCGPKAFQVNP